MKKPAPTLADWPWKISYGASDDRLHEFFLPALERSTFFTRTTGFFSSASLAIAATGVVRLIRNQGRMRLLCGAQLSKEDVGAIARGESLQGVVGEAMVGCLADPEDRSLKSRLEALAWMVAHDHLAIKVVLPRGRDGLPLPAAEAREYYHPKEGVFLDTAGTKIAFSGSSNESENGWQWNYETFQVMASWARGKPPEGIVDPLPHLPAYVQQIERRFTMLWEGQEESWVALDIPSAARERLLRYCPAEAPVVDPLEKGSSPPIATEELQERMIFLFLREAPHLPNADSLGIATSTIQPWPHQVRVAMETVRRFPEPFLFCDEVGLGKTIEVGLALRQLLLSGEVRRALILVPKAVLRQWQEELYEKVSLDIPRYDGGEILDFFDRPIPVDAANPWATRPILLASSHLAKRRDRQEQVLAAGPWDLVIVDEAHHARRKEFKVETLRPNRLLELLLGTDGRPGIRQKTRGLFLLTATPMQVDPVEVWDLLRVLGLGGRWGADEEDFLRFFRELRQPFEEIDWDFVLAMVRDHFRGGGEIDPSFDGAAKRQVGSVDWETIKSLPASTRGAAVARSLRTEAREVLVDFARRHTPIQARMWRNTRRLLRDYRDKGLLQENVPTRDPRPIWIHMTEGPGGERILYDRIEEYISRFYRKYEEIRKGLGFVMTVYRRRLTSSFEAIQFSLERRLGYLRGEAVAAGGLTDEDIEIDDLDEDVAEELSEEDRSRFGDEIAYVEDFIGQLQRLGSDSKFERLAENLREVFRERDKALIFTQYTDTMDYLRDRLRSVYGSQIACYSGRGGEIWDGVGWVKRPKEEIKTAFRSGDQVKILLCTESASEGLNLQTCGVLINYDMPWNPMRVEQRIGRIDRIGQVHDEVWIYNYFFEDTIEAQVYERLGDRIEWFEEVVGRLQPILHRVGEAIRRLALTPAEERARKLDEEVEAIRSELDRERAEGFDIESWLGMPPPDLPPSPVTLKDLAGALRGSRIHGAKFRPHPTIPEAYLLGRGGEERAVTFEPAAFDRFPNSLELLTYGSPLLDRLLGEVPPPPSQTTPAGIAWAKVTTQTGPLSLFFRKGASGVEGIGDLRALRAAFDQAGGDWTDDDVRAVRDIATEAARERAAKLARTEEAKRSAEWSSLLEETRLVLLRVAMVDLVRSGGLGTDEDESRRLPEGTIPSLGREGFPFRGLLSLLGAEGVRAEADPRFLRDLRGLSEDALARRRTELRERATGILNRAAKMRTERAAGTAAGEAAGPGGRVEVVWFPRPREI